MKFSIRLLYLYLFSFVGLLIMVIGSVRLVELGIKVFIFQGADRYSYISQPYPIMPDKPGATLSREEIKQNEEAFRKNQEIENTRQRQRTAAEAIAMIIIGAPLYLYHWKTITKENTSS